MYFALNKMSYFSVSGPGPPLPFLTVLILMPIK